MDFRSVQELEPANRERNDFLHLVIMMSEKHVSVRTTVRNLLSTEEYSRL